MGHEGVDVCLDDRGQLGRGEGTTRNPAWELRVPNEIVATHDLAVTLCEGDNLVTLGEGENTLLRLSSIL